MNTFKKIEEINNAKLEYIKKNEPVLDNMMDLLFIDKKLTYMQIVETKDILIKMSQELDSLPIFDFMNESITDDQKRLKLMSLSFISIFSLVSSFTCTPLFLIPSLMGSIKGIKVVKEYNEELDNVDIFKYNDKLVEMLRRMDNYFIVLSEYEYKFYNADIEKAYVASKEPLSEKEIYLYANLLNAIYTNGYCNNIFLYKPEIRNKMYEDLRQYLNEDYLPYGDLVEIFREKYKEYFNDNELEETKKLIK